MKLLTRMRRFLATLMHRSDIELDMDEELRSHIHERAVHLEQLGLSRAEAERRAGIEFGSYERLRGLFRFKILYRCHTPSLVTKMAGWT